MFHGCMKPWIPDAGVKEQVCNTMRLAAYAAERSNVVRALLQRMATLPEAIEIGRVTGLTLGQASPSLNLEIFKCQSTGLAWCTGNLDRQKPYHMFNDPAKTAHMHRPGVTSSIGCGIRDDSRCCGEPHNIAWYR